MKELSTKNYKAGWLYSVAKEGHIEHGDTIKLLERNHPEFTVARVMQKTLVDKEIDVQFCKDLIKIESLSMDYRAMVEKKLSKVESEHSNTDPAKFSLIWTLTIFLWE